MIEIRNSIACPIEPTYRQQGYYAYKKMACNERVDVGALALCSKYNNCPYYRVYQLEGKTKREEIEKSKLFELVKKSIRDGTIEELVK